MLRTIITASAAATLLYTPLLKRLCVVKNACVAAVIAASPVAGAVAAGAVCTMKSFGFALPWVATVIRLLIMFCFLQHGVALGNMVELAGFTFFGIMHREIMMDMNDVEGDRAAGVLTLPVVFGLRLSLTPSPCSRVPRDLTPVAAALAADPEVRQWCDCRPYPGILCRGSVCCRSLSGRHPTGTLRRRSHLDGAVHLCSYQPMCIPVCYHSV